MIMKRWFYALCVGSLISNPLLMVPVFAGTTPDSLSVPVNTGNSARILLIEGGYIGIPSVGNNINQSFSTTKKCPPNFKAFITMEIGKIMFTRVGRDYLTAYSACISSLTPTATNYTVAYQVVHFWGEVAATTNTGRYLSRSSSLYNIGESQGMFYTQEYQGFVGDHQSVAALSWRLFCYPPNLTPPHDQLSGVADCSKALYI